MLYKVINLVTAENDEKRKAATLLLLLALNDRSKHRFYDPEELLHTDFRIVAKALTGSESYTALANYFRFYNKCWGQAMMPDPKAIIIG